MKKLRVRKKVYESEAKINELIKKVARLKKISGKAVFELKEEYAQYYDPFYYHYSKIEQSKSEEIWRKNARTHPRAPDELPICAPPSFTTTYSNVVKISHSPVIVRVLLNVFRIAATEEDTKYWSVRLLHEVCYIGGNFH
jgi:E3 ubiquitin-protein ligase UBR2